MTTTSRSCEGKFELKMTPEPPYDESDGVRLGRARFDKRFEGPLSATSVVQMISARTPEEGSAAYVACEKIRGSLDGCQGSFVVVHLGVMDRASDSLTIQIVPGSGTGALAGLRGTMNIRILEGQHYYRVEYTLPNADCAGP